MGWWVKLLLLFTLPFYVCVAAKRKARCLVSVNWCGQRETKLGSGVCSATRLHGLFRLVFHFCKTRKGVGATSSWRVTFTLPSAGLGLAFLRSRTGLLTLDLS